MSNGIGDPNRLYNLMPSVYRERDEREGFPLRDLLRIVTEQADIVHSDIQLLWDNFFIETCERWAIPYIGDLAATISCTMPRASRPRYSPRLIP